jgi:hypothetical protein
MQKNRRFGATGLLPDKGSNLDIQIQNLTYYHYTIGQWDGKYRNLNLTEQEPIRKAKGPKKVKYTNNI